MEYSLKDLDKAILYYLSINKDTPKSITQIYNGLIDEAIVPNLNDINNHDNNIVKIKTVCYSINNKYEPIHKIFPNDKLHLLYSNSNLWSFLPSPTLAITLFGNFKSLIFRHFSCSLNFIFERVNFFF